MKKNTKQKGFFEEPEIKKLMSDGRFKKAVDDEFLMLVIAHRLTDLRVLRGLSQRALAKKIHMPQQEINDIEQGKRNLTVKTINRIAKALGSVPELTFREVHT
jgi:DNA-binding XRE family transcriptional regulator